MRSLLRTSTIPAFSAVFAALATFGSAHVAAAAASPDTVTNTTASGEGSMAAALTYANVNPGTTVKFNIPTTDPGFDGHVFQIDTGSLPAISTDVTIDGSTETAFSGDTNPDGPEVKIGKLPVSGGAVALKDAAFNWSGGTVLGRLELTGRSVLNWEYGTVDGTLNIGEQAQVNLIPVAADETFDYHKNLRGTLNNDGKVYQLSTTAEKFSNFVQLLKPGQGKSVISNNRYWDIEANSEIFFAGKIDDTLFNNKGTLVCNGGLQTDGSHSNGSIPFNVGFVNSGDIFLQSGELQIVSLTQTAGTLQLQGGNIRGDVRLDGGDLIGFGHIYGDLTNSAGLVVPSSPDLNTEAIGSFSITGNYTQGKEGRLALYVAGDVTSRKYTTLDVQKTVKLDGEVQVAVSDKLTPSDDAIYELIKGASRTGSFSSFFSYPATGQPTIQICLYADRLQCWDKAARRQHATSDNHRPPPRRLLYGNNWRRRRVGLRYRW